MEPRRDNRFKLSNKSDGFRKPEVVHSGHFMMSSVQDDPEDATDHDRDSPIHHEQSVQIGEYDFSQASKETKDTYRFGNSVSNRVTIDGSLTRLFQCMSLAYMGGKVVSPKWKNFKGLKLTVKDKIRLNNAIWRTWHIQYVMKYRKERSLIQFSTPLEGDADFDSHSRPEAVVMEGKYWKRRIETVIAEYKKWRVFYMENFNEQQNSPQKEQEFDKSKLSDEQYYSDLTDTLFTTLTQPFQFPNPREIAMHSTNSDVMQPGLLQLQPIMDDFIDFDPLQDLLNPRKMGPMSSYNSGPLFSDEILESRIQQPKLILPNTNQVGNFLPTEQFGSRDVNKSFAIPEQDKTLYYQNQHDLQIKANTAMAISQPQQVYISQPISQPQVNQTNKTFQNTMMTNIETYIQPQQVLDDDFSKMDPSISQESVIYTRPQMTSTVEMNYNTSKQVNENNTQLQMNQTQIRSDQISQDNVNTFLKYPDFQTSGLTIEPITTEVSTSNVLLLRQLLTKKPNIILNHSTPNQNLNNQKISGKRSSPSFLKSNASPIPNKQLALFQTPIPIYKKKSNDELDNSFKQDRNYPESDIEMPESSLPQEALQMRMHRAGSFSAEQKRRFNIKMGFDKLQKLLPGVSQHNTAKVSKASLMNKAVQYIKVLQAERSKMEKEIQAIRAEEDKLKLAISNCQQLLPVTGAPVPRPKLDEGKERFDTWVRMRAQRDWKFYIFGIITQPWFESYQAMVNIGSVDSLIRSVFMWVDEKCSLPVLRPSVVHSLQVVSTTTPILFNPPLLPQHINEIVEREIKNNNER